jgi:hypothetical protein
LRAASGRARLESCRLLDDYPADEKGAEAASGRKPWSVAATFLLPILGAHLLRLSNLRILVLSNHSFTAKIEYDQIR